MKKISILIILIFVFSFAFESIALAKTPPQAKTAKKIKASKKLKGSRFTVTQRLRGDRKALLVYFGGLQNANSVSYILIYKTNGQEEGAGGSVRPAEGNATRELLFGTCSKNICRYHTNITNMRLEVTAELKSGKKSGKKFFRRYKIRT